MRVNYFKQGKGRRVIGKILCDMDKNSMSTKL